MPKKTKKPSPDIPGLVTVRTGTAPKCGKGAVGLLSYTVGYHAGQKEAFLRITANESSGLFSDEWVPLAAIEKALEGPPMKGEPFRSKVLAPVFTGKSNNNAGFLCAVARQEGLLKASPDSEFLHRVSGDFARWRREVAKAAQKQPRGRAQGHPEAEQDTDHGEEPSEATDGDAEA